MNQFASNNKGVGYKTKNDARAGGLAAADAIAKQNPDAKIQIAVGSESSINKTDGNLRLESQSSSVSGTENREESKAVVVFADGFESENRAIAASLAAAKAMHDLNPEVDLSAEVYKQSDLVHKTKVKLDYKGGKK